MHTCTVYTMMRQSPAVSPATATFMSLLSQKCGYSVKTCMPKPYQPITYVMIENKEKYNKNKAKYYKHKACIKRQASYHNVRSMYKTPEK